MSDRTGTEFFLQHSLPSSWSTAKLADLCTIVRGASPRPKGDPKYFGGPIPWISIGDVTAQPGKWLRRTKEGVTPAGAERSRHLTPGTLIVSNSGTVCVPKFLAVDGCIHDGFVALKDLPSAVNADFLYYYFDRVRDSVRQANRQGITQVNLNTGIFSRMVVPLPPRPEQDLIVSEIEKHFTRLDAAVVSLKQAQAKLKAYRAAILRAAVDGQLIATEASLAANEGRSFESGEQLIGRAHTASLPFLASSIQLPQGWAVAALGDVAEIQGGIQKQPKRAPRQHAFPFLRVANVLRNRLDLSDIHRVELFGDELNRLRLQSGDLLIVEGNGSRTEIGRMAIWNGAIADCVHQNHIIRARLRDGIEPAWASIYWNSPQGSARVMEAASSTSGLYTLSVRKVSMLPLPIPPRAEQRRMVSEVERRFSTCDALEAEVTRTLLRSSRLRSTVLMSAFDGRLVSPEV